MSCLIAVGSSARRYPGEALLWIPDHSFAWFRSTVGVDLGKTTDIGEQVGRAAPEVLILTHDDSDHIGGWSGFAPTGLATLEELWVPYEWGALVGALAELDPAATDEISVSAEIEKGLLTGSARGTEEEVEGEVGRGREAGHLATRRAVERAERIMDDAGLARRLGILLKELHSDDPDATDATDATDWRGTPREVARRAASRAVQLCRILHEAARAGVRIRYFSVDHVHGADVRPWEHLIGQRIATIANAVEVRFARHRSNGVASLAYLLFLTIQNRRALCTVLWDFDFSRPAALAWSDSSGDWTTQLSGVAELIDEVSVSTAPHHGSTNPAHNAAWSALAPFIARPDTVMLLAGGEPSQPDVRAEYRWHVPADRRGCTRCRHDKPASDRSHPVVIQAGVQYPARVLLGGCRV